MFHDNSDVDLMRIAAQFPGDPFQIEDILAAKRELDMRLRAKGEPRRGRRHVKNRRDFDEDF